MGKEIVNRSSRESEDGRKRRWALSCAVLAKWFDKWRLVFPTHEVTQRQILAYAEALDDLSPEMISAGCCEAGRTAEQFPKPGHIRRALEANYADTETISFGPPAITYPEVSQEERDAAIEERKGFMEALKKQLGERNRRVIKPVKPIDQQLEDMRKGGYLQ